MVSVRATTGVRPAVYSRGVRCEAATALCLQYAPGYDGAIRKG